VADVGLAGIRGCSGPFFHDRGLQKSPASLLASFDYTTLVWATLFGYFLFNDFPDIWTVLGAMIIVVSGMYLIRKENQGRAIGDGADRRERSGGP
jgi:drug/metabolite transporter (DMT)-like permease